MDMINKRPVLFLVVALLIMSAFLYHTSIFLFPSFIHAWTQSDRYAIALGFLNNGFDLFHPVTYNLQTVEGITRVDFPINEFIVALLMKVFGTAPVVFRVYTLCVSITGLVFLYLLAKKISASETKARLAVLFVFFSPAYAYYQAGFIPSIPAISCVFIAYYYFFSYKDNGNKKQFYLAVLFFLLAALMRLPFIIFLFAVLLQQLFMMARERKGKLHEFLSFIAAFAVFISYYLYNVHLGRVYGSMFLDSLLPAKTFAEFKEILAEMYDHWIFHYFTMWHYILLFVLILISVLTFYKNKGYREEDKKYWFQFLIVSIGAVIYFLLMARQYYAHDYYFLDSLFIPVILLFIFVLKNLSFETLQQELTWSAVFGIAVILFFISNKKTQAERYSTGPWDRVEITRQNFTGAEHYLDSIGVPKDVRILVIDAYTTNAPLILMNRKGYTVMGTTYKNIGTALQWCKWDYVAVQDIYLVSDVIKNYPLLTSMLECVGSTGTVSFYKKSKHPEKKTLQQFLGITPERTVFNFSYNSATNAEHKPAQLDSVTEYGVTAAVKAAELKETKGLKILVKSDLVTSASLKDIQLVASVSTSGGQLFYQSFALSDYFKPSAAVQKMEFQFVLPAFKTPEDELKIYLWNPGKARLLYDNWEVIIYR